MAVIVESSLQPPSLLPPPQQSPSAIIAIIVTIVLTTTTIVITIAITIVMIIIAIATIIVAIVEAPTIVKELAGITGNIVTIAIRLLQEQVIPTTLTKSSNIEVQKMTRELILYIQEKLDEIIRVKVEDTVQCDEDVNVNEYQPVETCKETEEVTLSDSVDNFNPPGEKIDSENVPWDVKKKQVEENGSNISKYEAILKWTYDRFIEARIRKQQVTMRMIQQ
ncbi:hypothetical protein KPH14_001122 [Odynerus spinipes]|uniref:Uncharacterized protein n=1 Tax=Odynerus spinipes TaxID=1348599 RepID=A0AAD9VK97_9HYME|nr:hypothetical protein KPH14_001122 [Odynerus spinipes]